jgi:hypothetical protein
MHARAELQEFIALRPNAREVRKALVVKLVYQGYLYEEIQTILDVSLGSITGWKQVRRFCALVPSFSHLKWMFEWFIRHTNE